MYEEAEYKFDWSKVIIKLLIVTVLTALIITMIFLFSNKGQIQNNYFQDNLDTMVSVAKNYYSSNEVTDTITLEEMIDKKMIIDFIDEDGNNCDLKNSYAKITNNKLTVNLTCNKNSQTKEIKM